MIVSNKVAVITGAASGIGLALAKTCVVDGWHVVMSDIDKPALEHEVNHLNASTRADVLGVACDVADEEQVNQLALHTLKRFNRIDLLINNAGMIGHLAPIWELSTQHIEHILAVNLHGVLHCVKTFLPILFEQSHRSQIVNMASLYGLCSGSQIAAYAMSKHGIVALSESLFFDLQRLQKPVDISVVCPSFTNTQLLANSARFNEAGLHHKVEHLMKRSRSADDVAHYIMREIKNKTFYILPDKEVKNYCEQRTQAIIEQTPPHEHSLEKIFASLSRETGKSTAFTRPLLTKDIVNV